MRTPWTQLYVHLVWRTWDRLPLLSGRVQAAVYACIRDECAALQAEVIAIGGMEDHIHLLVRLPAAVSVATLVKQVKGASSHLVNHKLSLDTAFKWQGAYGAFTVSPSAIPAITEYIRHQEEHHRVRSIDPDLELPEQPPAIG
jgi:putative transposase